VVSCDIHPDAVAFLGRELGVTSLLSTHVPEEFTATREYDVVFALSFFSHLPRATWGRWLKALFGSLSAPGHLVFTTHGTRQCEALGIPAAGLTDGFWYSPQSEQASLDTSEYGSTITLPEFVIGEIYRQTGAPIVRYEHAGWWETQDVWIVKRDR
jgi:hypothetical protein